MYDGDNIPFEGGDAWLYIENGQAQWLVGAPVTGAPVAANNPAPAPATDPALIPPGVIEDGVHFGYAVNATNTSISFDRADVQADGSWTNNNPKVRTLPVTPDFWSSNLFPYPGQPIEIHVQGQRVTMLTADAIAASRTVPSVASRRVTPASGAMPTATRSLQQTSPTEPTNWWRRTSRS